VHTGLELRLGEFVCLGLTKYPAKGEEKFSICQAWASIGQGARIFPRRREMVTRIKKFSVDTGLALAVVMAVLLSNPVWAANPAEQQGAVDKALVTFQKFMAKKARFRDNVKDAKALLIVPVLVKGGIILGGSGGSGVLVSWNEKAEDWSQPAFYTVRSVTFGLQVGVGVAEVIMMIKTQKAMDTLFTSEFELGGEALFAAGPVGVGYKTHPMADVVCYFSSKGLFGGLNYEGAVVKVSDDSNKAYYGRAVNLGDIIVKNAVSNPGSAKLREAIRNAVK
jgi:lipid-binding SYLF domain-containing protein